MSSHLESKINFYMQENEKLKNIIKTLNENLNNIQNDYYKIKEIYSQLLGKEKSLKKANNIIKEKNEEIINLKKEINKLLLISNQKDNKIEINYEKDVNQIKYLIENNQKKIESANQIEKLNNILYNRILELENLLSKFKEEEKLKLLEKEKEFENKIEENKDLMIDYLNSENKKVQKVIEEGIKYKINNYYHNNLVNELEYKNIQLENLYLKKENLNKIIFKLKNDIEIHKITEKDLVKKNFLYSKSLLNKKNNENNNLIINKNNFNNSNKKLIKNFSLDINGQNNLKELKNRLNLYKDISKKHKEIENYKSKYEICQSKLNTIEKRFSNLINYFDEILLEIYNDKNFNWLKNDIYLNINEFINCDFEKLSSKQKYSILVVIIQKLIPIILNDNLLNENVLNIRNIKTKLSCRNYIINDNSTRNVSTFQTPTAMMSKNNFYNSIYSQNKPNNNQKILKKIFIENDNNNNNNLINNKNKNIVTENKKFKKNLSNPILINKPYSLLKV